MKLETLGCSAWHNMQDSSRPESLMNVSAYQEAENSNTNPLSEQSSALGDNNIIEIQYTNVCAHGKDLEPNYLLPISSRSKYQKALLLDASPRNIKGLE